MIELDIFRRLIEKYKFADYIPDNVQSYVIDSKVRVIKASLKSMNELGIFYRIVIHIYFKARYFGLRPSVILSKVIAAVILFIIFAVLTSGIAFAVNKSLSIFSLIIKSTFKSTQINKSDYFIDENVINNQSSLTLKNDKLKHNKIPDNTTGLNVKIRLGISNIIASGIDENEAKYISAALYKSLQSLKGKDVVISKTDTRVNKSVNRNLIGRLSKVGKTYIMAISVVNSESGDVLYSNTITYEEFKTRDNAIKNIADEISRKSVIWQ
jgi:hypothetical protein